MPRLGLEVVRSVGGSLFPRAPSRVVAGTSGPLDWVLLGLIRFRVYWVAVKEIYLSYYSGINLRYFKLSSFIPTQFSSENLRHSRQP